MSATNEEINQDYDRCTCRQWTNHATDCPKQFFKEVALDDMNPESHYIMKENHDGREILLIGGTKNDNGTPGWIHIDNDYGIPHVVFQSKKIMNSNSPTLVLNWSYFWVPQEYPPYFCKWSKHQVPPLPQTTSEIPRFIKSALRSAPDDETKVWRAELEWSFPGRCPILRYHVFLTDNEGEKHVTFAMPNRWREYCFFDPESYIVTMW